MRTTANADTDTMALSREVALNLDTNATLVVCFVIAISRISSRASAFLRAAAVGVTIGTVVYGTSPERATSDVRRRRKRDFRARDARCGRVSQRPTRPVALP